MDINMTPSTNTLPIRRLNPGLNKPIVTTAGWVQFPRMKIQPVKQTYTKLGPHTYTYSAGSFKTRIKLDHAGLVEDYPPFWKRQQVR